MKKLEDLSPMEIQKIWIERKDIALEVPLEAIKGEKSNIDCSSQPQDIGSLCIEIKDMKMINEVYKDIINDKITYLILKVYFGNGQILHSKLENNNCKLDIKWDK